MPGTVLRLVRDLPPRTGELRVSETCSQERRTFRTRRGIPPSVALFPKFPYLAGNERVRMYVAGDALVALHGHPLHRYLYGSAKRPDLTSGHHCRPVALAATVRSVWSNALLVERADARRRCGPRPGPSSTDRSSTASPGSPTAPRARSRAAMRGTARARRAPHH